MADLTLAGILADIASRLADGARDRRSPMHTPAVATADADVRVMVLRGCDADAWTLRLHTDARSPKVTAISGDPRVGLLFYDPAARIQVRARGEGRIEAAGPEAEAAWQESSAFARRCYLAEAAPGAAAAGPASGLPAWAEGIRPSEEQLAPARANFAVLLVDLRELDWLSLAHDGHRRARFVREGSGWQGSWAVP